MKFLFKTIILSLLLIESGLTNEVKIFSFTEAELFELEIRKVRGADNNTIYTIGSNENGNFLKAVADNAASGLGKEVKIDLNKTPFINITWKIEKDLAGIKETTKKGHDFAARVFAIKKTGATPLSNRSINYVFSSNNEIGFNSPSPYTKKSIDNVLATTKENLNEWITVKANVKEDFKKFHNLDVNELDGLAIMSDTDNSKKKTIAYYQNIYFSSK
jgi:predicted RNA-binding protein with RPS1 domain